MIQILTQKGPYRLSTLSASLVTFLFCCCIVMAGAAVLLGVIFQLLALMSPFLITAGSIMLKCTFAAFLSYRLVLWLWRLRLRKVWIDTYVSRRELVLQLRRQTGTLLKLLALLLFR